MSAKPDYVVNTLTRPTGATATGGYVINLTSSTTPMALSQPKDPTLAQYTFFVSRRLEDGRERFRLHMGYFETQQAAEEMLAVVREVYPSAWAGEAPGKKLRPNASAAAPAAPAPRAAAPAPQAKAPAPQVKAPAHQAKAPAPAVPAAPQAARPAAPVATAPNPFVAPPAAPHKFEPDEVPFELSDADADFKPIDPPVVHPPVARPVVSPPRQAAAPAARAPAAKPAPQKPAQQKPAARQAQPKAPARAAAPARPAAPKPSAPAVAAKPAAARPAAPARPPVAAPKIAAQVSAPALQAAAPAPVVAKPAVPEPTVQMPAIDLVSSATPSLNSVRQAIDELDDLSDTQTIRLLERHSPYREGSREADVDEAIRVIKPEDTQSMLAIKSDVKRNAPVLFAVQLDWSVTPFDMAKVPPLAIFNAYTLYTTEANRDGRAWYGLRLGFFSDAVSAKQVAYYVRSDFKTVSVVPVTTLEKERATDLNAARSGIYRAANIKDVPAPTPQSIAASGNSGVFQLLEDDTPEHIEQDVDGEMSPRFSKPAADKPAAAPAAAPAPEAPKPSAKSRKPPSKGARRDAHAQVDEETLDQTLEILGANSLEITNDSAGDTGVRHLRVKIDKKGSKFASLIDRLSGKK
ncbi:MAG TPA: hypothetical protein VFV88_04000 [Steroidobacteraceae bacterium]|jgi:hypothetical protein|nr:hypothetical protein [Steroidobacteraceae bacterium]